MHRSPALDRLVDPGVATLAKLLALLGLAYPFQPIDLIPDRIPLVGQLDNLGLPVMGAVAASFVLRAVLGANVFAAWALRSASAPALALGRRLLDGPAGRLLIRLLLGRPPTGAEQQAFAGGLWSGAHAMPPLLRGIASVPSAAPLLSRAVLLGTGAPFDESQRRGNLATVWTGPRVRFLHLEKTAGSSLVEVLAARFHPAQIHRAPDGDGHDAPGCRDPAAEAHRRAAFAWGHYDLPRQRALDGGDPCFRLCLLRDPERRILSLYWFWRGSVDLDGAHIRFAKRNGLLAFLRGGEPSLRNDIDNLYARRLAGLHATECYDPLRRDPAAALARAEAALDGLDFVGLSERMDDSLRLLGRALGFAPPARAPRANVQSALERNPLRPRQASLREPITPEIRVELDRLTALDRVLYERARRRFEASLVPDAFSARCPPAA